MSNPDRSSVIRFADAEAQIPSPESDHAVSLLERGTLKVKLSIPVRPTVQTPHIQDELYFVVRWPGCAGSQWQERPVLSRRSVICRRRDGTPIEAFTDLAVWVVFCGVEGGEVAA